MLQGDNSPRFWLRAHRYSLRAYPANPLSQESLLPVHEIGVLDTASSPDECARRSWPLVECLLRRWLVVTLEASLSQSASLAHRTKLEAKSATDMLLKQFKDGLQAINARRTD